MKTGAFLRHTLSPSVPSYLAYLGKMGGVLCFSSPCHTRHTRHTYFRIGKVDLWGSQNRHDGCDRYDAATESVVFLARKPGVTGMTEQTVARCDVKICCTDGRSVHWYTLPVAYEKRTKRVVVFLSDREYKSLEDLIAPLKVAPGTRVTMGSYLRYLAEKHLAEKHPEDKDKQGPAPKGRK